MAVQTALAHRRVLPQPRPTLLCVALITSFVDRVGLKQRTVQQRVAVVRECAVRIVAVVAAHLPFRQRHVGAAVELQANIPVALRARVVDRGLRHEPFGRELSHGVVAITAAQPIQLMHRVDPMIARPAGMTC